MSSKQYSLQSTSLLLRDGIEPDSHKLDALVASGDCFVTLATQLDELTQSAELPPHVKTQLEATTRLLLELQRHYSITQKPSDYRQ